MNVDIGGMVLAGEYRSTGRKTCPSITSSTHGRGVEPGPPRGKPSTNHLSRDTA